MDKMSNCCSARVENERCADCGEMCKEIEIDEDTKDEYGRENLKRYTFIVEDEWGIEIYKVTKPSIEMLEEEIGRFERHFEGREE